MNSKRVAYAFTCASVVAIAVFYAHILIQRGNHQNMPNPPNNEKIDLPRNACNIRRTVWSPTTTIGASKTYISFPTDKVGYQEFLRSNNLDPQKVQKSESDFVFALLGSPAWKLESGMNLDWWKATDENPDNAVAVDRGTDGILIVKLGNGFVYVVLRHAHAPTPGPF